MGHKVLELSFFDRPAVKVAEDLIGKYLMRKLGEKILVLQVKEVEAYDGFQDRASHAHRGQTERNAVMFGPAGYIYVYLCYGMYWMLNIVTGPRDYPAALLIRGAGHISGPGRLTRALSIDNKLNGKKVIPENKLWFEDRKEKILKKSIIRKPRIGVDYAGPVWAKKLYRFLLNPGLLNTVFIFHHLIFMYFFYFDYCI